MKLPVYLDNHSTTPLDDRVLEAMLPYFRENYGNPSSAGHSYGWIAEAAVRNARERIADSIGASPDEIIFTSGTTESNNLVIKGLASAYSSRRNHFITSVVEHPAVIEPLRSLEKYGFMTTFLPVDKYGLIDLQELEDSITPETLLVSIMTANNEIGTISPVDEIAAICSSKGVYFHTDAAQAAGKMKFDVKLNNADLVSFSAHKIYGPKGIGALYIRKKTPKIKIAAQLHGGGQERDLRSGTLNVPAIVGFAKAMEVSQSGLTEEFSRVQQLRDRLSDGIMSQLSGIVLNGHPEKRLPNNLNISIKGVNIDTLLLRLRDLALSSGSACTSGKQEPSHVLKAIGVDRDLLKSTLRFGIGRFNTIEEIDYTIKRFIEAVNETRNEIL